MKRIGQLSLSLCFLLILQIILPTVSVFAESTDSPNDIRVLVNNGNNLQLRWTEVSSAQSYNIYQIKDNEKKLIGTSKYTYFNITNQPEGDYSFVVTSYSAVNGESVPSAQVEITLIHPKMAAPQDIDLTVRNGNNLFLKWSEVEFATGYNIYQIKDGGKELLLTTDRLNRTFANMPEGNYVYEVHSVSDRFGESKSASQVSHSLVHPVMAAPAELSLSIRNGNDIILKWSETEFATSYNIYRINNEIKELVQNTDRVNRTFIDMPADDYIYEVHAVSDRFGESQEASHASYSLVHPEMTAPAELNLSIRNGNDIVLKWSETEFATGYNIYQIEDGVKKLIFNTDRTVRTLTNMPAGDYVYEVHSVSDRFGESEAAIRAEYSLVHPQMVKPQELNLIVRNGNDLFLKWTEVEFATSYNVYQLENGLKKLIINTTNLSRTFTDMPEGDYEYEVTSISERFGESQTASQVAMTLVHPEMEAPSDLNLSVRNGNDLFLKWTEVEFAKSYNIYHLKNDEKKLVANTTNVSRTFANMPEDWYEYEVTAVSDRFGESAPSNIEYTLGHPTVKSPELQLVSIDEQTATIKWAEIDGASVYNIYEVIEGDYVFVDSTDKRTYMIKEIEDGNHEYVVTAIHSRFGESIYSNTVNVEVQSDLTAPVTTSNANSEWMNQDFEMILVAQDDKSGVDKTFYSFDGVEFQEGNKFTLSKGGTQTVSFYSKDLAGNAEEVKTANVKIDKTAPETSTNIESNWHQEFTVQLNAEDAQSGVDKTFYSVNGSEFTEGDKVVVNKEGINTITFYSTDLAGNVEEVKAMEVKIDQTTPETISNINGEWHQKFAVELTGNDDKSGVETTFYSINGSEFKEGSSFMVTEEGINAISFYSADKAGNVEEVKTAEVKIDQTAPETISNTKEEWLKEDFVVELSAKDDLSGIAATYYSLGDSEFEESTNFQVSKEGINEFQFYSKDIAGNIEDTKTSHVKIDKTVPLVSWSLAHEYALGTELSLTYSATDAISGINSETLTVNGVRYANGETILFDQPGEYEIQLTVIDNAGWVSTLEKTIVVYLPLNTFEVKPGVIKGNRGVFSVEVTLPKGFDTKDFVLESAAINGISAITGKKGFEKQAEKGHFRFNREDFSWVDGFQVLEFRGMAGEHLVVGKATVETKAAAKK